jgi:IS1 family transposase
MANYRNIEKKIIPYVLGKNSNQELFEMQKLLKDHKAKNYYFRIANDGENLNDAWYEMWSIDNRCMLSKGEYLFENPYDNELNFKSIETFNDLYLPCPDYAGMYVTKQKRMVAYQLSLANKRELKLILKLFKAHENERYEPYKIAIELSSNGGATGVVNYGRETVAHSGDFIFVNENSRVDFMEKDKFLTRYEPVK